MVEEQATVVDCEGEFAWVETQRQSSCGHCSVKNGCGTQVLSKIFGNKTAYVRCINSCHVKIGDRVIIGINESALLSGSFLLYLLPLLSMIIASGAGVAMARQWWPHYLDLSSIIMAVAGLLAGLKYSRYKSSFNNANQKTYEPVILKKVTPYIRSQAVIWDK